MMSVTMNNGDMVIFSIQATDHAGNSATVISPPLVIDTLPQLLTVFSCNQFT